MSQKKEKKQIQSFCLVRKLWNHLFAVISDHMLRKYKDKVSHLFLTKLYDVDFQPNIP